MQTKSPNFKLNPMRPLSEHHKNLIEEEPDDLDTYTSKISFNENLIVCTYKPTQSVTIIRKTILKLKGYPGADWINPTLQAKERKRSTSILKQSPSPTRFSSYI